MRSPGLLVVALLLSPPPAPGQEGPGDAPRNERNVAPERAKMESLESHLEEAVGRVSIPHAGILLGRASTARGYRLPGYGVLFVLTPRALPGAHPVFVVRQKGTRGGVVRIERHAPHPGEDAHWVPEDVEELERQVLVLQHAAEAQRRAAEEDMDRIVEDVRVRVEVESHGDPLAETHDVTVRVDDAGDEPPPGGAPEWEMREPPWKFWFEGETSEEKRTPDGVVGDVRTAVIEALESQAAAALVGLEEDEFVTVAVDFVPGDLFASRRRPTRTLIVRARQRDLAARAHGALAPEQLRERVEVIEY